MIRSGEVLYHDALRTLMVPIDTVTPHPENDNEGDIDLIADSIRINGMYRPLYAQTTTRHIIAGNSTYLACVEMHATEVPVLFHDLDDNEARRIVLVDNSSARKAIRDLDRTRALLQRISDEQGSLRGTGYGQHDLETINRLAEIPIRYDHAKTWPTLTITCPPDVLKAFHDYTDEADTDSDRLEVLLRLAGWDGA